MGECSTFGGGILNVGKMIMSNSIVLNNTFSSPSGFFLAHGGRICNGGTSLTVTNSTFNGNSTLSNNNAYSGGGGISNFGTVAPQISIVGNSTKGGNCHGTMTSKGYNLSSDNTCNFNSPGDLNDTNPQLGPLHNNGGPTQIQALPSGSLAIDAGNPSGCTDNKGSLLKTDQRGQPRPDKEDTSGCDMGSYESQSD